MTGAYPRISLTACGPFQPERFDHPEPLHRLTKILLEMLVVLTTYLWECQPLVMTLNCNKWPSFVFLHSSTPRGRYLTGYLMCSARTQKSQMTIYELLNIVFTGSDICSANCIGTSHHTDFSPPFVHYWILSSSQMDSGPKRYPIRTGKRLSMLWDLTYLLLPEKGSRTTRLIFLQRDVHLGLQVTYSSLTGSY